MRPRYWLRAALALGAATAPLIATSGAFAATDAPGTQNLQLAAGQLSVGPLTPGTLQGVVGGIASGQLPSASFSDTTGSGNGWQGAIAVSDFIYTGAWAGSSGAPALAGSSAGAWTGTADGISITVTVGSGGSGTSTPFSWSDSAGHSGSGTATNGTPALVEDGVTIDFAAGTVYASGDQYSVRVGAQAAHALSLDAALGSITPAAGVQSPPPGFVNSGAVVVGGGTTYGTAVPMVSAAVNEGMGTYAVAPGAQVATDASSWAATYVAQVQYTIATGPSSAPVQVAAGATTPYAQAVLDADPAGYWPLNDTTTQAVDLSGNGNTGTYVGTYTQGAPGPLLSSPTIAATSFSNGWVVLPNNTLLYTTETLEAWFKTTSGGVIVASQNTPAGGSSYYNWDPALYVGTDGRLWGEIWNGSVDPIATSASVNNGSWQFVALVATPSGESLYLNGQLVGTSSAGATCTVADSTSSPCELSYTQIGWGWSELNDWPDAANSALPFVGTIGQVDVVHAALTQQQIQSQYAAAGY